MSELTKVVTDAVTGEQITIAMTPEEIAENENSYQEWLKVQKNDKQPTIQQLQTQLLQIQAQLEKLTK